MAPRVSVVVPSYNHERFVQQAIQSVLDQSFQDFEIVITDDASRDRTTELIRAFDDPRISLVVFPHNRGACIALNHSIERARGEHLCYLATDDYYLPGKLAKQVAYLDQHPEVLAVFGMPRHVDENGRTLPRGFTDFSIPYPTPSPTRAMWLRSFFFRGNSLAHPTAMVRRSAYERVGLFDPRLAGLPDFDMWVRICMVGEIFVMQEEIAAFRLLTNAGNMSAPRTDSVLRDSFEFFEILKHFRRMPPELALQTFGGDLHRNRISTDAGFHVWLAEIAALGPRPAHALFALDTLFEMSSPTAYDHNRLIALVGQLDPFGLGARAALAAARRIPPPPGPEPMRPQKVGRNDFCPCGSGKKYKNCHGQELASFVDRQASDRL